MVLILGYCVIQCSGSAEHNMLTGGGVGEGVCGGCQQPMSLVSWSVECDGGLVMCVGPLVGRGERVREGEERVREEEREEEICWLCSSLEARTVLNFYLNLRFAL